MKKVYINLAQDKKDIHSHLAQQLEFPPYYGNNLDALYDVMSVYGEKVQFVTEGTSPYGEKLLATLWDITKVNNKIYINESEETSMTVNEARAALTALQTKLIAYGHASGLFYVDGTTIAPKDSEEHRAKTLSVLGEESYKLSTSKETEDLLEFLDAHKEELTEEEARIVYLMLKDLRKTKKIPADEYLAMRKVMVESGAVWHKAKEANDWSMFEEILGKMFDYCIKIAKWVEPDKAPFDYWLANCEEGLDMATCDEFFATLRSRIVPLLKKINEKPEIDDSCIKGYFPKWKQQQLSDYLMDVIGIDKNRCIILETEHPYTANVGTHFDVRLTTHYHMDNLASNMFSVLHEGGHSLYDLGVDDKYTYTMLDDGAGMSVHEGQSRFYENYIGRSRAFINLIFPKVKEIFPEEMKDVTAEDFYRAVNKVETGCIRIEADELTYCLHIMVRYELEKRIFAGELQVKDLPAEWNRLYKEYLGVDVPDDRHGVLQDSHWGGGLVGYFPSYALGSAYGAQVISQMKKDIDVEKCIAEGNLAPINAWNTEKIWQYGSLYNSTTVLEKAFGGKFDPMYYVKYLEDKFTELYDL
ncbi:MAG: barstar family protein [Oscillospiraceae bacterium]|nr:barstar family protein [Oscillospiraceae bacterium]